jgi:DNA-binding beta-propeller fold protein YncE
LFLSIGFSSALPISVVHPSGSPASISSIRGVSASHVETAADLPRPHVQLLPSVADTLVLYNDTLVPGNYRADNGIEPNAFAYDRAKGEIFVSTSWNPYVSVVNDTLHQVVATVQLGYEPSCIGYDSGKGEILVAGSANSIGIINDTTDRVVANITLTWSPYGYLFAYAQRVGEIFATNGSTNVSVINDTSDGLVGNVTVPSAAWNVGYDASKNEVLVDNGYNSNITLSFISTKNNSVVANIPVALGTPASDPSNNELFVPDGNRDLSVISDVTNTLVANISVGRDTDGVVYDAGSGNLYVANDGSNDVSVVSAATGVTVANVSVGSYTTEILYDLGAGLVFAMTQSGMLAVISTTSNSIAGVVQLYSFPWGSVYDSGKGEVFVTNSGRTLSGYGANGSILVINGTTDHEIASIEIGLNAVMLAYDRAKGEVFVAASGSRNISVISDTTDTIIANVTVGYLPAAVAYDGGRGEVFVGDSTDNISIINDTSNTVVANISLGGPAAGFAYVEPKGEVYATHGANLSVINDSTNTVVANLSLPYVGSNLVYDYAMGELFVVTNVRYFGGFALSHIAVVKVSTGAVVGNISVGKLAAGIALDNTTGQIYVTNSYMGALGGSPGNVSVISAANDTVVTTLPVGMQPVAATWDPVSGEVFISNFWQGTLSIISANVSPSYPVIFGESGLAPNTEWNVTFANVPGFALAAPILFTFPNGTYSFNVGKVPGYSATPESGNVTVNGSVLDVSIAFSPVPPPARYPAGFEETGLNSGTTWSINLNGSVDYSSNADISFNLSNGTYDFAVDPVSGFMAHPDSGNATINGSSVTTPIEFVPIPPPMAYEVSFNETGLPAGRVWSVVVGGTLETSSNPILEFNLTNGTHSFSIPDSLGYSPTPVSGAVAVNGSPVAVAVTFHTTPPPPTYLVTFFEAGLPKGVQWYLNATGPIELYSGATATTTGGMLPNGSYTYSISSSDKRYQPIPSAGTFTISGAALGENVTFQFVTYSVSFSETGLPSGIPWSVTLNGLLRESNGSSATFEEPNGTFGYNVTRVPGYTLGPTPGLVTVAGGNQSVTLSFRVPTFQVIFSATGLPKGVDWIVEAPWGDNESNSTDLVVWEPNGTYKFNVQAPNGYTADPSSGTLVIAGAPTTIAVNFTIVTSQHQGLPPGAGIPEWVWILAITAVFAVGLGIVIAILSRKPGPPANP